MSISLFLFLAAAFFLAIAAFGKRFESEIDGTPVPAAPARRIYLAGGLILLGIAIALLFHR